MSPFRGLVGAGYLGDAITVGRGGRCANMADADEIRRTRPTFTTLATFVGSTQDYARRRLIVADSGTPLAAYVGRHIAVRAVVAGCPWVRGVVLSGAQIQTEHPLLNSFVAQDIEVAAYKYTSIFVLPGNDIVVDMPIPLRDFTRYMGFAGASTLTLDAPASCSLFVDGESIYQFGLIAQHVQLYSNEWHISGLSLRTPHGAAAPPTSGNALFVVNGVILGLSPVAAAFAWASQYTIVDCDAYGGYNDGVFLGAGGTVSCVTGGLVMERCNIVTGWDCVRACASRSAVIRASRLTAMGANTMYAPEVNPISVGLGGVVPLDVPSVYLVDGCDLEAQGFDLAGGVNAPQTAGVNVRHRIATAATLIVRNTRIRSRVDSGAAHAYGIHAQATAVGAETPAIRSYGNTFHVTNGGIGDAHCHNSMSPDYVVYQANNYSESGGSLTNGTHVAALVGV